MQCHHLAGGICQKEQITTGQIPEIVGGILDRRRIMAGHQSADDWQIGQQRSRALQRDLALLLKIAESGNGILKIALNLLTHLLLYCTPHNKESSESERRSHSDHGEQELGPQPKSTHGLKLHPCWGDSA